MQKVKNCKAWQRCEEKILLGYHNSGFSVEQVTVFMLCESKDYKQTGAEIQRIKIKAMKMGVILNGKIKK